jgi:general stress protein 26
MNDTSASRDKLWKMIKDIRFAMFTTRHGNGHLHARPMTTQNKGLEADESLWFFMSKKGDPVADLKVDPTVNVVYANPSSDTYVSVSGTAAMIEDAAKKEQLWGKLDEAWFPGGAERSRPRSGPGPDRSRQLLGREGDEAGPAADDGQGRLHRQAADRARRARRSAHALSAQSVTRRKRCGDLPGEHGVVRGF